MKQIRHWLTTVAVLLCSITASAYDFQIDGIYYNITSAEELTVESWIALANACAQ